MLFEWIPNIFNRWDSYYESHRQSNCVFKSLSELAFLSPQTRWFAKFIAAEQKRLFSAHVFLLTEIDEANTFTLGICANNLDSGTWKQWANLRLFQRELVREVATPPGAFSRLGGRNLTVICCFELLRSAVGKRKATPSAESVEDECYSGLCHFTSWREAENPDHATRTLLGCRVQFD